MKINFKRAILASIFAMVVVSFYALPAEVFFSKGGLHWASATPATWKFFDPTTGAFLWGIKEYVIIFLAKVVALFFWAVIFEILYSSVPGRGVRKGLWFGILMYLIFLPAMIDQYFFFNMTNAMNAWFAFSHFVEILLVGLAFGYIYRNKESRVVNK